MTPAEVIAYIIDPVRPRCSPTCLGFFMTDQGVERCDDCAFHLPQEVELTDNEIGEALHAHAGFPLEVVVRWEDDESDPGADPKG